MISCMFVFITFMRLSQFDIGNKADTGWYIFDHKQGLLLKTWVSYGENTHFLQIDKDSRQSKQICSDNGAKYYVHDVWKK